MYSNTASVLQICDFEVPVHLGCTIHERHHRQNVNISVEIFFSKNPQGEFSDQLQETVCYAEACEIIKKTAQSQEYQLVEKLAKACLLSLKESWPESSIKLTLHKTNPPIEGLRSGVKYICGDLI